MHDRTNGRIFKLSLWRPEAGRQGRPRRSCPTSTPGRACSTTRTTWHAAPRLAASSSERRPDRSRRAAKLAGEAPLERPGSRDAEPRRSPASAPSGPLHAAGGLDEDAGRRRASPTTDPYVRAWTIRLATEDENPSAATLAKFAEMAKSDPSPVVRLDLASALQRMPLEKRWEILEGLVAHAEDATDHNLPLMDWYAAEPLAAADPARA